MTKQEAKKLLRETPIIVKEGTTFVKYATALSVAMECIEKQIPKPKHKYQGIRCVCGTEVAKYQKYCDECGQRLLDWGDNE